MTSPVSQPQNSIVPQNSEVYVLVRKRVFDKLNEDKKALQSKVDDLERKKAKLQMEVHTKGFYSTEK